MRRVWYALKLLNYPNYIYIYIYITNYFQTLINLTSQSLSTPPPPPSSHSHQDTNPPSRPHSYSLSPLPPSSPPSSLNLHLVIDANYPSISQVRSPPFFFFRVHSPPCLCLSLWPKYPSLLVWFGLSWLI